METKHTTTSGAVPRTRIVPGKVSNVSVKPRTSRTLRCDSIRTTKNARCIRCCFALLERDKTNWRRSHFWKHWPGSNLDILSSHGSHIQWGMPIFLTLSSMVPHSGLDRWDPWDINRGLVYHQQTLFKRKGKITERRKANAWKRAYIDTKLERKSTAVEAPDDGNKLPTEVLNVTAVCEFKQRLINA